MEVLFITHKYPPSVGGMEKQSYELINGVSRNHKVHTLIWDNKTSKVSFLLSIPFKVKKILKENPGISLIHLNDGLIAAFSLKLTRITKVPIVATIHGLDIVFPSTYFQKMVVKHFKSYDGFIAVSRATAQECLNRGFDPEKVFYVLNGVDTEMAHIQKKIGFKTKLEKMIGISLADKKILVSVGRSVRRKGFSWFLKKVLPKLDQNVIHLIVGPTDPNIHMIKFFLGMLPKSWAHKISLMFGLGLDEIEIKKVLQNPAVNGRAFYLGKLPFNDMVQTLKHADLFVMPNIKVSGDAEGFGLVALEAAICGLPVVASALEGITCAVVDGENGFLVPAERDDLWVSKITNLLSDDETLKHFGEMAKHYSMTNFAWDKMVDGYITVFKRILNRRKMVAQEAEATENKCVLDPFDSVLVEKFLDNNAF